MKLELNKTYPVGSYKFMPKEIITDPIFNKKQYKGYLHAGNNMVKVFVGEDSLDVWDYNNMWWGKIQLDTPSYQRTCTCGGYTTYGSWEAIYHSDWCDSRKSF